MKKTTSEFNEKPSIFATLCDDDDDTLIDSESANPIKHSMDKSNECLYRIITLTDAQQAIQTMEIHQQSPHNDISEMSCKKPDKTTQSTTQHSCCRLVRSDKSSRLLLPLARRGRPHLSSRSSNLLCQNCLKIKENQQNDILQKQQRINNADDDETDSMNIFDSIKDFDKQIEQENKRQMIIKDIPQEIEFSLINDDEQVHKNTSEYEPAEMLVWKINTLMNHHKKNTINLSYDTGSLTDLEKKKLIQEAIQKLQIVLSNRSTTSTTDNNLDEIEFTYQALQTTVNILSSSFDSL